MRRPVLAIVVVGAVIIAAMTAPVTGSLTDSASGTHAAAETLNRTNTSDVLRLPSVNRSGLTSPELDLSTALTMQELRTEWRLAGYAVEERFDSVSEPAAQREILIAAVATAEQAVDSLRSAQRTALRSYANGSINAETLLARLGRLDVAGRAIDGYLGQISQLNQNDPQTVESVKNRVLRVRAELGMLTDPIRTMVADVVAGRAPTQPLFVGVGSVGVTLSTVTNGKFLHHTVRLDNFADEPASSDAGEALDRWAELYPGVWDDGRVEFTGLNGAYQARLPFDGGYLVSFLDSSTLMVYAETQSKTVADLPGGPPITSTRDELVVTVNRTYPGGPLRVSFRTDTGDPLDGVVRVNGRRVGTTGEDGVLWTTGPATQFAVTVDYGDRQVAVVVTPVTEE